MKIKLKIEKSCINEKEKVVKDPIKNYKNKETGEIIGAETVERLLRSKYSY